MARSSARSSPARVRVRDAERSRAHILQVAFKEIFAQGYHAASVNDIVAQTRLTKGAFFHHFPTKRDLGYAIVDEVLTELTRARWLRPLAEFVNPIEGVSAQLLRVIDATPDESLALGCPLNNLTQEMSASDPTFRCKLGRVLELWIDGIERELRRAQRAGYLKPGVATRPLAEFIVMAHEGAFGIAKNLRDKRVFRSLQRSLAEYLDSVSATPVDKP